MRDVSTSKRGIFRRKWNKKTCEHFSFHFPFSFPVRERNKCLGKMRESGKSSLHWKISSEGMKDLFVRLSTQSRRAKQQIKKCLCYLTFLNDVNETSGQLNNYSYDDHDCQWISNIHCVVDPSEPSFLIATVDANGCWEKKEKSQPGKSIHLGLPEDNWRTFASGEEIKRERRTGKNFSDSPKFLLSFLPSHQRC